MTKAARKVARKARHAFDRMVKGGTKGPEGEHVLMSSQTEAIIGLRSMPIPPSAPDGPQDFERDRVDPVAYRREKNRAKRSRRARGG